MYYITSVRLFGGFEHEHISQVRWRSAETGLTGEDAVIIIVGRIRRGDQVRVYNDGEEIEVRVVDGKPPYLRTFANGIWCDHLLDLPRF